MNGGMTWREADGIRWLEWRSHEVRAVFPSRSGGVSRMPWHELNLSLTVGDEDARVLENRARLCAAVGVDLRKLIVPQQVHGSMVREVGRAEAGAGATCSATAMPACDALVTGTPEVPLGISTADCLPIVMVAADGEGVRLAAVHAGWRGIIGGIVGAAAAALASRGRLLAAAVGPGIGPCCFVVDEALRARFDARSPGVVRGRAVDLVAAATSDLRRVGMPADAISASGICTSCDARFFSHRRDQGATGRHLAMAWRERPEADTADGRSA